MAGEGKADKGAKAGKKAEAEAALKARAPEGAQGDDEELARQAEAEESDEESARAGEEPAPAKSGKPKPAGRSAAKGGSGASPKGEGGDHEDDEADDADGGDEKPKGEKKGKSKPRPRPKVDADLKRSLDLRVAKNAQRQEFHRQEWFRYQRLGTKWRAPGGIQSKMRRHWGTHADVVSIGYRGPKAARGLHPSGFKEVLVHNPDGLEAVDPAREAVRIASSVGKRKRVAIQKAAVKRGIRVLNWRQY